MSVRVLLADDQALPRGTFRLPGARDRAQLVVIAHQTGLVRPGPRQP
ncbi:hypothetical protein [Streptomyces sp. NPDC086777]